jgi:hypothetical protein
MVIRDLADPLPIGVKKNGGRPVAHAMQALFRLQALKRPSQQIKIFSVGRLKQSAR